MVTLEGFTGTGNDLLMKIARSAGVLLLVAVAGAIVFLVYFRHHGGHWLARKLEHESWRHGWREKIAALLEGFSEGLRGIRTWNDLGVLSALTAAHWILVLLIYFWVIHAFPGSLSTMTFGSAVLVTAFTLVGSAAQIPTVGGGSQAACFLVLTLIFGVEQEPAAVVSIVLWLIAFAGCSLAGLPLLFREGWSMGELRKMAQAKEQASEAILIAHAEHATEQGDPAR